MAVALLYTLLGVTAAAATTTPADLRDLVARGEWEKAVSAGQRLISERGESAEVLIPVAQAMAFGKIGTPEQRIATANRALDATLALDAPSKPLLAQAHYTVGVANLKTGHYPEASTAFEQALSIAEAHYGADSVELEIYLREAGVALYGLGEMAAAKSRFQHSLEKARRRHGVGHPATLPYVRNLANAHYALGEAGAASEVLGQAIAILKKQDPPDPNELVDTLGLRAVMIFTGGDTTEAIEESRKLLRFARDHYAPQDERIATSLHNLATMLSQVGDYQQATLYYGQCIDILDRIEANRSLDFGARLGLALAFERRDDLGNARRYYEQAKAIGTEIFTPDSHRWADFLIHYGELQSRLGKTDDARASLERAARLLEQEFENGHVDQAIVLDGLGRLALLSGAADEAVDYLERARGVSTERVGNNHPLTVSTTAALARAYYDSGKLDSAFAAALDAERRNNRMLVSLISMLPERRALGLASLSAGARDVLLTLAGRADSTARWRQEALDVVIRGRARVFDELAARRRSIGRTEDETVRRLLDDLRDARTFLSNLFVRGPIVEEAHRNFAKEMEKAEARVTEIETELADRSASFRRRFRERDLDAGGLSRLLPVGSALLSFVEYRQLRVDGEVPHMAALIQRARRAAPAFVDLGPTAHVADLVDEWGLSFVPTEVVGADAVVRYRSRSDGLRQLLWDRLSPALRGADTVFVVPEGPLHQVSFAALPGNGGRYMIEEGPLFHYLTAERDLLALDSEPRGASTLLALGNPSYDARVGSASGPESEYRGVKCESWRRQGFGALPETERETNAISETWKTYRKGARQKVLVQKKASEDRLKTYASEYSILHLATHGFFLGDDCGSTPDSVRGIGGLVPKRPSRPAVVPDSLVSPLLLSGLVLAGGNRRFEAGDGEDDGILTAEEVATLDLQKVGWAVLSACRTGAGTVRAGEGIFGLRRAFQIAGAATVITNLWDADDTAARRFMENLYRIRLSEGLSTAEAMRQASLDMLHERRTLGESDHPFYWGGWLAVGDPR